MTSHVKIVAAFLVAAAFMFAIFYFIDAGADRERAKINKENSNAIKKANEFDTNLGDCVDPRSVYDFETGKCRGPGRSYWKLPSWLAR